MESFSRCDEAIFAQLTKALRKAIFGKSIAFVFEEGVHRIVDDGQVFETPNDTITFRLFVNGGMRNTGEEYGTSSRPVAVGITDVQTDI